MDVKVNRREVYKMVQLFARDKLTKGLEKNLDAFLGNGKEFNCWYQVSRGWGDTYAYLVINPSNYNDDITLDIRPSRYTADIMRLYGGGLNLKLKGNDPRIKKAVPFMQEMLKQKVNSWVVTRYMKSYYSGKRNIQQVLDIGRERMDKEKALFDELEKLNIGTGYAQYVFTRPYYKGSSSLKETVNKIRLNQIKQGGAI